jgi:FkbM family methyltransferase
MTTARTLLRADAANPLVRALVRAVSKANNHRYRLCYVPAYRSFLYLNLSEPLTLRRLLGQYEKQKFRLMRAYLKPGMTFVDVGANLGDYTFVASRLVRGGKVVAFEPDPSNYSWLSKSIERNRVANVDLRQEALSDRRGQATLFLGEVSGWHTLKPGQLSGERGAVTVRTTRLDDLVLDRIDLVKIDVEGAEFEVLQGAKEQLRRHRPIVLVDLHPTKGADIPGVLRTLRELDFEVHAIDPQGRFVPYTDQWELAAVPRGRAQAGAAQSRA